MRAIVNTSPGVVELLEVATPQPGPGEVRIRTAAFGICATDLQMIDGWSRTSYPAIPGHEWCGYVDAIGPDVDPAVLGAFCVGENVRARGGEVGFEHPGGYAEMLITDSRNVYQLPPEMSHSVACLIEPLAVCVRGSRRLGAVRSQPVIVMGDGPIGLLMVMLLRHAGAGPITLVGGRPERLGIGQRVGASEVISYRADPDWATGRSRSSEAVVEATGSAAAADAALDLLRPGGRLLILGDYGEARSGFRWTDLLHREALVIGSNASAEAWPEAVALATKEALPLGMLATHHYSYHMFEDAFRTARSREAGAAKVIVHWTERSSRKDATCEF